MRAYKSPPNKFFYNNRKQICYSKQNAFNGIKKNTESVSDKCKLILSSHSVVFIRELNKQQNVSI